MSDNEEGYFKRLKHHPGIMPGILMTAMFFYGASQNKSIHTDMRVLILGGTGAAIVWACILISNIKRKKNDKKY